MNWKNEEQYQDYTAAEAMFRVMGPVSDRSALLNDDGCRALVAAIVRQAVDDHIGALRSLPASRAAERIKETERFFRSEFFTRLTGLNGDTVLRLVRKEMSRK